MSESSKRPLHFEVLAKCETTRARASRMTLGHGPVRTPVFMPVGTQGTVKAVSVDQLHHPSIECEILLGNTYHLANRPGAESLKKLGGLHKFSSWTGNILTDSGGFQMVSLLSLADITEEGVEFESPVDGSKMLLTPEESMRVQNAIGSDIMMALDDVVSSVSVDDARFEEACDRTLRWIDRCIKAHERRFRAGALRHRSRRPGRVGWRSAREVYRGDAAPRQGPSWLCHWWAGRRRARKHFGRSWSMQLDFAAWKARYLMGVGYPLNLVVCVALGVDMFDCVYPRTARFGTAMVSGGLFEAQEARFCRRLCPH